MAYRKEEGKTQGARERYYQARQGRRDALRKQDMKSFLGKVTIVGQHVGEPFAAHHLHGGTIGEAIMLIRTGEVEIKGLEKAGAGLGNDREAWDVEQGLDVASRTGTESWRRRTVIGEELRTDLVGRVQLVCGVQGIIEGRDTPVPPVPDAEQGNPVERIDKKAPHAGCLGVP